MLEDKVTDSENVGRMQARATLAMVTIIVASAPSLVDTPTSPEDASTHGAQLTGTETLAPEG